MNISELKRACAQIVGKNKTGSGYLIDRTRVATCHHVISGESVEDLKVIFSGEVDGRRVAAVASDEKNDCALLTLTEAIDTPPLKLAETLQEVHVWIGYGYPALAKGAGLPIKGEILEALAEDDVKRPARILYSDMIAAGQASPAGGFSGSPVVVGEFAVGHLTKILGDPEDRKRPAMGIVYACPSSVVLALAQLQGASVPGIPAEKVTATPIDATRYHAFLSYRSSDKQFARALIQRFEAAKLKVFFAENDLAPGDQLSLEIGKGIRASDAGIILVSSKWMESPWCLEEANMLIGRAIQEPGFRLIPVRLDDTAGPEPLRARIWVDFKGKSAPEGPEYDRLLHAVLGTQQPTPSTPEGRIERARNSASEELIATVRAASNESPHQIMEAVSLVTSSRLDDETPFHVAAQALVGQNRPDLALEVLSKVGTGIRAQQLRAYAFGKLDRIDEAIAILDVLRKSGPMDPETEGMLAGRYRQRWRQSNDQGALLKARDLYRECWKATRDTYNGVNAASLSVFLGERAEARRIAFEVLQILEAQPRAALDHWQLATIAETHLINEDLGKARERYQQATAAAGRRYENVATMRTTARKLLEKLGEKPNALDDALPTPKVVVFAGHRIDPPGRTERFPNSKVGVVRNAIRAKLDAIGYVHGFAGAAAGADVIFLDVLAERNSTARVVMPFEEEAFLRESSYGPWVARWKELRPDVEVEQLALAHDTPETIVDAFVAANSMVLKLAMEYAKRLDDTPVPLLVWDGQPGGPGGTADIYDLWTFKGLAPIVIRVDQL